MSERWTPRLAGCQEWLIGLGFVQSIVINEVSNESFMMEGVIHLPPTAALIGDGAEDYSTAPGPHPFFFLRLIMARSQD